MTDDPELTKLATGFTVRDHKTARDAREKQDSCIDFRPVATMSASEREAFEDVGTAVLAPWPEVGTGAMQRLLIVGSEIYE